MYYTYLSLSLSLSLYICIYAVSNSSIFTFISRWFYIINIESVYIRVYMFPISSSMFPVSFPSISRCIFYSLMDCLQLVPPYSYSYTCILSVYKLYSYHGTCSNSILNLWKCFIYLQMCMGILINIFKYIGETNYACTQQYTSMQELT